jgi:hypothetical protein
MEGNQNPSPFPESHRKDVNCDYYIGQKGSTVTFQDYTVELYIPKPKKEKDSTDTNEEVKTPTVYNPVFIMNIKYCIEEEKLCKTKEMRISMNSKKWPYLIVETPFWDDTKYHATKGFLNPALWASNIAWQKIAMYKDEYLISAIHHSLIPVVRQIRRMGPVDIYEDVAAHRKAVISKMLERESQEKFEN